MCPNFKDIIFLNILLRLKMDKALLEILACPLCKGPLVYKEDAQELWCRAEKLAYKIKDDIPIMLADEARKLSLDELDSK